LIPPYRFTTIQEKLYRGGFPLQKNFPFLSTLKLKTIVSLIPSTTPTNDLANFCSKHSIKLITLNVQKAKETVTLSTANTIQVLHYMISPAYFPLFVHCLNGANVTGLVVMCLRKLQCISKSFSTAEFCRFIGEGVVSPEESEFVESFIPSVSPVNVTVTLNSSISITSPYNTSSTGNFLMDIGNVTILHSSSESEIEIPLNPPSWLWPKTNTSIIPSFFFKSCTPLSNQIYSCQITYMHPTVRIKLPIEYIHAFYVTCIEIPSPNLLSTTSASPLSSSTKNDNFSLSRERRGERSKQWQRIASEIMDDDQTADIPLDSSKKLSSSLVLQALALEGVDHWDNKKSSFYYILDILFLLSQECC
jgi:tyrosine-protein phosphatase OCA6